MDRRWAAAAVVGVVALVGIAAVLGPRLLGGRHRPNVLVVLWDTARADRMSLYGYDKPTTPRLDAFAKDAAVYERATAPGMWTLNSHAAMFTGLYETSHGAKPAYRWLDQHYTTFAELAHDQGYDTFFYSSNLIASPMTNLTQGFDTVHTSFPRPNDPGRYTKPARRATRDKLIPDDASTEISPAFTGSKVDEWEKAVFKDSAPIADQALFDWLSERTEQDKPFLAYLNLMEAHTPRIPSMSARRRVADEPTIATALATDASLFASNEYIVGRRDYAPEELAAIGATYDAALVDLDDATGDILDRLKNAGLLDDTVVIVVADHGEGLGEHRRLEHRWSVYEPLLHVPLVIRYPAAFPPGRIADRVTTLDLFATVVDMLELERPAGTSGTSLVGRSAFDPRVFSQMLDPFASQLRSVQKSYPDLDVAEWARTYCVVYEGAQKLIYASNGQHALYDLATDPGEERNLIATVPDVRDRLEQALTAFEGGLPVYDPELRGPDDGVAGETREQQAWLTALGYTVDDVEDVAKDFCGPFAAAAAEKSAPSGRAGNPGQGNR
ncbi:MAG: sulfatase [Myxococcota bacterium]